MSAPRTRRAPVRTRRPPSLRAQAVKVAPDLPEEAFDRVGRWRGLASRVDADARFVADTARALHQLRLRAEGVAA